MGKLIIDTTKGENDILFKIDKLNGKQMHEILLGLMQMVKYANVDLNEEIGFSKFKTEMIPTYDLNDEGEEVVQIEFKPEISLQQIKVVLLVFEQYINRLKSEDTSN